MAIEKNNITLLMAQVLHRLTKSGGLYHIPQKILAQKSGHSRPRN